MWYIYCVCIGEANYLRYVLTNGFTAAIVDEKNKFGGFLKNYWAVFDKNLQKKTSRKLTKIVQVAGPAFLKRRCFDEQKLHHHHFSL